MPNPKNRPNVPRDEIDRSRHEEMMQQIRLSVMWALRDGQDPDPVAVLVRLRGMIEGRKAEAEYPVLFRYGNWVAHPGLTRLGGQADVLDALEAMSVAMVETWTKSPPPDARPVWTRGAQTILALPQLRAEMQKLFDAEKIPTNLCESYSRWTSFVMWIFLELLDRPIMIPLDAPKGDAVKKQLTRMRERAKALPKAGPPHHAEDATVIYGFMIKRQRPDSYTPMAMLLTEHRSMWGFPIQPPERREAFEMD